MTNNYIENRITQLITAACQSGYYSQIVFDAIEWEREGFTWDVALTLSSAYWLAN